MASINQFANGKPPKQMCSVNKTAFFLSRHFPWLAAYILNSGRKMMQHQPDRYIRSIQKQVGHLCQSDQEIMQSEGVGSLVLMHLAEAFRQGVKEGVAEPALLSRPWGFDCADIRVPVQIWHGTADTLAPVEAIREMEARLPNCQSNYLSVKGHFMDADPEVWRRILVSLVFNTH